MCIDTTFISPTKLRTYNVFKIRLLFSQSCIVKRAIKFIALANVIWLLKWGGIALCPCLVCLLLCDLVVTSLYVVSIKMSRSTTK